MANRFCLGIFVVQLTVLCAWADPVRPQPLNIYLYNKARVPSGVLTLAEESATRIFRLSGVQAIWVNCSIGGSDGTNCAGARQPSDIIVQIVPETRQLKGDVFGVAFLGKDGAGQYTDIYYNRLEELRRDWKVALEEVLAHVIAHEIGHLLLGLNAHSNMGIMRGVWETDELRRLERGRLFFSSEQAERMKRRLAMVPENNSVASSRQTKRNLEWRSSL